MAEMRNSDSSFSQEPVEKPITQQKVAEKPVEKPPVPMFSKQMVSEPKTEVLSLPKAPMP
jgi:hypothetical protein